MKPSREYRLTITGLPAVTLIALLSLYLIWRLLTTNDAVTPEVAQGIHDVLAAEYARSLLPSLQEGVAARDETRLKAEVDRLETYTKKITFSSLKSRSVGNQVIVRADILVDGKAPPTGKSVRYFRFSHSILLGYVYQQESFAVEYWLPFLAGSD